MVAEMNLNRDDVARLRDASDDTAWLRYRTRREWALPASEVQRIGADRDKLIAVRVRESIAEFKRGDIVMLDRSANSFREDGYYGVIVKKEYLLVALRAAGDDTFLMTHQNDSKAQRISAKAVTILGAVVYSCRPRINFSF